jgi:hypothetical protein
MNQQAQALHTAAIQSLDAAFRCDDPEFARVALNSALHATRHLARLNCIMPSLVDAVNETRVALMARGWA